MPGVAQRLIDTLNIILPLRQQAQQRVGAVAVQAPVARPKTLTDFSQLAKVAAPPPAKANPLAEELSRLMPARFLEKTPFDRLPHLPRYLKALITRAERATLNPAKDQERSRQIAPYAEALNKLTAVKDQSVEQRRLVEEFRWLVEEFKVSIFAQELGTAVPISAKRLDQHLERLRQLG